MRVPAGAAFGARGRRFWKSLHDEFEFSRPDDLEVLVECCRLLDEIELLRTEVVGRGVVVVGSQGQPVANPSLAALQTARATFDRLLRRLGLNEAELDLSRGSRQAAKAANSRWGNVRNIEDRRRHASS